MPALVSTYFGKDLTAGNGLNIEGLPVQGDQLIIGFRAQPLVAGRSSCGQALEPLFAKGDGPGAASSATCPTYQRAAHADRPHM